MKIHPPNVIIEGDHYHIPDIKYFVMMSGRSRILILITVFLFALLRIGSSQSDPKIQFVENKNQWPKEIDYGLRVSGGNMFIGPAGFRYYFLDQQKLEGLHDRSHTSHDESSLKPGEEAIDGQLIQVNFLGSSPETKAVPFQPLTTYYNYFIGNDPSHWASKARAYEGVNYSSFYNGIDLKLYSSGDFVKYDFVVAPGADVAQVKFEYSGVDHLSVMNGDMHVKATHVSILEKKPEAFQMINNEKISVACEYVLSGNVVTFGFPEGYNSSYELVIDPLLIFSTYSGSLADNWGSCATPGEHGNLYSSGVTIQFGTHDKFPATPGAFQTAYGGLYDVAILKYDSLGQHLLYASYLGGSQSESPHSLVMNGDRELLVLGTTSSADFPTTAGAISQIYKSGHAETNVIEYATGSDLYVAKISSDGSHLLSSTFLGGTLNDGLNPSSGALTANYGDQLRGDILTDRDGNVYISTVTSSSDFPVGNSFNTTYGGGATDALIMKLNDNLTQVLWGAFLGGTGADASHTIQLDKENNVFVAGGTNSSIFPATAGAYQATQAGSVDGWIARISNDGSALLSSTLTGTSGFNQIYFLDLNSDDEVYVYGQTEGTFPVTAGVYSNPNGGQFLQKFSHDLTTLKFSTVFGSGRGIPDISPTAFLVNDCNNIYMSGWGGFINTALGFWEGSSTRGMPLTDNAYQKTTSGSDFYFMVLTADASQFLFGTYLGGTQSRTHVDGGTSRFDKSGIVYHAVCSGCESGNRAGRPTSDFPTTPGVWSRTNNSPNCNNAAFKFDLSSLKARIQTNAVGLKVPGLNKVCFPDKIVFQNRSTGGKSYEWKFGDNQSLVKTDTSAITYQYAAPGQYTVKLKAFDPQTCLGTDSTSTVVNVYKAQGAAVADLAICKDATVHIAASGGGTYVWKDTSGKFNSTLASPEITPSDTTRYFVTITDVNGCIKKDTVKVSVVPGIDLKFDVSRAFDCLSRPMVRAVNTSDEKADTFIDFGDGVTTIQKHDQHIYDKDGIYSIRVVGKKAFCTYDKKIDLPFYTLFVPTVFTPGGSPGFNDAFRIKYGDKYISESGINVSLVVYDRWGVKVYENRDYKDNWTGDNLVSGTYFYEVGIQGETTCKNWVQIIR